MLKTTRPMTSLVVCSTCRSAGVAGEEGRRAGARFADALEACLSGHPCEGSVEIQPMPCLFACAQACTVHLRSPGRIGYVLGHFQPSADDACALLDYVYEYGQTADGVVPYAQWPQGVKGHFIVRMPPEGYVWQNEPVAEPLPAGT